MRIENGLNPNCSELVTKVDNCVSIKDMLTALIDLAGEIKCSYGIEYNDYQAGVNYVITFSLQEMSDYLMYDPREDVDSKIVVSYNKLLAQYPDLHKKFEDGYDRQPKMFYGQIKPGLYYVKDGDVGPYLSITENEGYSDTDCLTFRCSQHCCSNEFPLLNKVMKHFGTREQAFDGGSTSSFEDWQTYWGVDCEADKKITEEPDWYSDVPPEWVYTYAFKEAKNFSEIPTKGAKNNESTK